MGTQDRPMPAVDRRPAAGKQRRRQRRVEAGQHVRIVSYCVLPRRLVLDIVAELHIRNASSSAFAYQGGQRRPRAKLHDTWTRQLPVIIDDRRSPL